VVILPQPFFNAVTADGNSQYLPVNFFCSASNNRRFSSKNLLLLYWDEITGMPDITFFYVLLDFYNT